MNGFSFILLLAATPWGASSEARQLTLPVAPAATVQLAVDTVVALRRGDRVVVRGLSGSVAIGVGPDDALHVVSERRADRVQVRRSGERVAVSGVGPGGGARPVDVSIRVPSWVTLEIDGIDLDVSVVGLSAPVSIGSVSGDLRIEGTSARVQARTIEGTITALETTGPLVLSSHSDDVFVRRASGPVDVRSLAGDVTLGEMRAAEVRAETQAGDIDFSGEIHPAGRYQFLLHSGDVRLELPSDLSARVYVSTFDGEFESDFPVVVAGFTSGREFEFTVGAGAATVRVEVFDGEIRLIRGR